MAVYNGCVRILQVIHDFLPDHRAGSEIYTYHLSQALAARGHDVRLLFTEKRPERPQFEVTAGVYDGLPFHEIVYNRLFHDIADLYDDPRMEAPIARVLDEVAPDVIHVQSLVYLGLGLLRVAEARSIPAAMTLHEYFLTCARGGLRLDLTGRLCQPIDFGACAECLAPFPIERARYADGAEAPDAELGDLRFFARAARVRLARMLQGTRSVRRFVAPSRFLRDRLVADGLPAERVVVADYGFPGVPAVPRAPRQAGDPLRFGYLGTLSSYKGVEVLVEAYARLSPGMATLRIKGDPTWFPDFMAPLLARQALLEGLQFEGPIAPAEAPRFLAEIDVLVVPSLWFENSPLTMHEAFQCGVPVIATDLGGMRELLAEGGGLLFRRGDAADLAACMRRIIERPEVLQGLRQRLPLVKSIEANAEEMEAILRQIR